MSLRDDLLNLIKTFLSERQQRAVLNRQESDGNQSWRALGSIYGEGNVKPFADDTSLSSVVHKPITASVKINKYLEFNGLWAYQWKMSFDSDPPKQAQECTRPCYLITTIQ